MAAPMIQTCTLQRLEAEFDWLSMTLVNDRYNDELMHSVLPALARLQEFSPQDQLSLREKHANVLALYDSVAAFHRLRLDLARLDLEFVESGVVSLWMLDSVAVSLYTLETSTHITDNDRHILRYRYRDLFAMFNIFAEWMRDVGVLENTHHGPVHSEHEEDTTQAEDEHVWELDTEQDRLASHWLQVG